MKQYLALSKALVITGGATKRTQLARFLDDDAEIKISINGEVYSGPLFYIFDKVVKELNTKFLTQKVLQKNSIVRKDMSEVYGNDLQTIIRECVSNMIVHSSFKSFITEVNLEIVSTDESIYFSNSHTYPHLMEKIRVNPVVPHFVGNQAIFDAMRMLNVVEGRGLGFQLFRRHMKYIDFDITYNTYKIILNRKEK